MKEVTIYSSASCDWNTREGRFFAALEYHGHYKFVSGNQSDSTADRCILIGIIEAIHLINEPCKLTIVTATRFAFNRFGKPKGSNKELKQLLLGRIKDKQCEVEFDVWPGGGDHLKSRLSEIEKVATKVEPQNVVAPNVVDQSQPAGLF